MKVRFTKDTTTKDKKPLTFKAGDEVDFYELYGADAPAGGMSDGEFERNRRARAEASASHWINRGAAERIEDTKDGPKKGIKSAPEVKTETKPEPPKVDDLAEKTVQDLHEIAKAEGLEGVSGLHKDQLVKAIQTHRAKAPKK